MERKLIKIVAQRMRGGYSLKHVALVNPGDSAKHEGDKIFLVPITQPFDLQLLPFSLFSAVDLYAIIRKIRKMGIIDEVYFVINEYGAVIDLCQDMDEARKSAMNSGISNIVSVFDKKFNLIETFVPGINKPQSI